MNTNPKLSFAIAAILSGSGLGMGMAHADTAADTNDADAIQEITVTATRRSESLQDVPITIQAVTGEQLKQLSVSTLDDLLKYTPNVTFAGNLPGGGNIFMRGLSAGGEPNQSQSTTSPFPNVALYLDDQSMQFPGRNNDVYLVDMERVEVLEGPQGTLFGGGAEAGAIRYITNKPKLDVTEGNVEGAWGITAGGDDNARGNATINLPLIPDMLAVRATVFEDHRGGYIDNVPGTISYGNSPVVNNAALVGTNTNPVTYTGARFSALVKFNDDWNFLIQQNYQNMEADGYFSQYPTAPNGTPLGQDQIVAFAPAYDKDRYESTAWTLNGQIGWLKAVYTGSYLDRHIQQQADYSNYLTSGAGSLYTCTGAGAGYFNTKNFGTTKPTTCYAPVGDWNDTTRNTHQSHEIRLSTPDDQRLRGLVGGYWEDFIIYDQMNFNYLPIPQCNAANLAIAQAGGPDCVSAVGPLPGNFANDPSLRTDSNTAFGEDVKRGYRQAAVFTSVDFDLIPKVLTVTGGTRYFHYDEFEQGSEFFSETTNPLVFNHPNGVCTAAGGCGFGINLNKTESGFRSRGNIAWHITPDMMAYYTFSQGFRPGGFNRTSSTAGGVVTLTGEAPYIAGDSATKQYNKPAGYNSDSLTNNEIGFKTELLDHRLQINASAYLMHWNNVQYIFFDPVHLGNTTFVVNGPSYNIKGFELQLVARPFEGLTVQGSGSWNYTKQSTSPCLISNRPTATNPTPLGDCITQVNSTGYANPYGEDGSPAPFSPESEFNLRARYDWTFLQYKPFVWVGANHMGSMNNEPANYPPPSSPPTTTLSLFSQPSYTTYDAAIGVGKDNWVAQLIGNNLTNSNASTFTSTGQFIESQVPLRPRVLMVQFNMKF